MPVWPRLQRKTLWNLFEQNEDRLVNKCVHYFPIYERHFSKFRGTSPRILELGVFHGGSLDLWRRYFGAGAHIVGADINERCLELVRRGIDIRIGNQGEVEFLESLVDEGPYDIVIDDGSHLPEHQILAAETLWQGVRPGGVLLVEDLCTNYWPDYGGALRAEGTFVEWVKPLVDEINGWNIRANDYEPSSWTKSVDGMHVYDSVVVLEKASAETAPLRTMMTGRPAFHDVHGLPPEERLGDSHMRQLDAMSRPMSRFKRHLRRRAADLVDRFSG